MRLHTALGLALALLSLSACRRDPSTARTDSVPPDAPQPETTAPEASSAPAASPASASPAPSAAAAPPGACEDLVEVGDAGAPKKPPRYDVLGVDMSTPSAFRSVRDAGYAFVMVQAGLGAQANKDFARNWTMAQQCGLPRGAYHFLHPKGDPTQQADLFVRQLDNDFGELPPVVDVELPPGCKGPCCDVSCEDWASSTSRWLERVKKATGRKPMVYTVEEFWKECLCNTSKFANHGLWLAGYPTFDLKARPGFGGWQKWVLYQHAGNVRYGHAVLDLDVFRGDRAAFDALVAQTRTEGSP